MPHSPARVSEHLIRVYRAVVASNDWCSSAQVTAAADVAPRTARAHLHWLARAGVVEWVELSPEYRYRLAADPTPEAAAVRASLEAAMGVLAIG